MKLIRLIWNRLVHEYHMKRYGWHYTEKPMWGKPLMRAEFRYESSPVDPAKIIIFKREKP